MSKRQPDEFFVVVELSGAESPPSAEELDLLDANFDLLFRFMLDQLAATAEED